MNLQETGLLIVLYWLHMLSTVIWLGGLVASFIFLMPQVMQAIGDNAARIFGAWFPWLQRTGWISLLVLTGTGMFQMSAHPSYEGLLGINNTWALAIFIKHGVILLLAVSWVYMGWRITPSVRQAQHHLAIKKAPDRALEERIFIEQKRVVRYQTAMAILILLLTAWARVS